MEYKGFLEELVDEDFGFLSNGNSWGRADIHDSLVINREKQLYYWNSKNLFGDAYHYLINVRNYSHQNAKELLRLHDQVGTFIHTIRDKEEIVVYPKLVDIFHEAIQSNSKDYFYARTITDETISRFKLGYYNGFYTIPVYQDGILKQILLRRDFPKKLIRKYYRNGEPLLFNSDIMKITNKVYYAESPISALVLSQNGFPGVSCDDGAVGFMEEWYSYFLHQKEIYLLFDNDSAGIKGALRTAKILGEHRCKIYNFQESGIKGYGVDDYFIDGGTADELKELLNSAKFSYEILDKDRDSGRNKNYFNFR